MADKELALGWSDAPTCPHCGERIVKYSDWPRVKQDGAREAVSCAHCNQDYWVTLSVTFKWQSDPPPEPGALETDPLRKALRDAIVQCMNHNASASHVTDSQLLAGWTHLLGDD